MGTRCRRVLKANFLRLWISLDSLIDYWGTYTSSSKSSPAYFCILVSILRPVPCRSHTLPSSWVHITCRR